MRIAVCIKQVPAMSALEFDPDTKTLKREGVRAEVSAFDLRAVIKAVQLVESHGGDVTVITMGPPAAREALLECLALGAARGIHLCDAALAGADTLATARALAAAIRRDSYDLILCGRNSIDAETGQVGPEIAEILDLPQITAARTLSIEPEARRATAERETEDGIERVSAPLPVVVSAAEDLAAERFTTKAEREAARERPIEELTAGDLDVNRRELGALGSPTWVLGLDAYQTNRGAEIIEADSPEGAVDELVARLLQHGLFGKWKLSSGDDEIAAAKPAGQRQAADVLVVAETVGGKLRPVVLELLHKADSLAEQLGGDVSALLAGPGVSPLIDSLSLHGARRVFLAQEVEQETEAFAALLCDVIRQHRPGVVLLGSTAFGRDVAPRVAARLGLGLTGDCIDLTVDDEGRLLQHKPAFGGSIVALIASRTLPEMATVRPGMLAAGKGQQSGQAEVLPLTAEASPSRVVVESRQAAAETASEMDHAAVVVGFGKGIGGPDNLPMIQDLAAALDAAICTTRDVTDEGWLPKQYQVGITGRAIAPQLYVAVALRGAFEHTAGINRSGLVVAINRSAKAPIFKVCDYGLVGDYATIVPLLTKKLLEVKKKPRRWGRD